MLPFYSSYDLSLTKKLLKEFNGENIQGFKNWIGSGSSTGSNTNPIRLLLKTENRRKLLKTKNRWLNWQNRKPVRLKRFLAVLH